ncbi:TIGR03943 family putative permease subunit [Streptomyces sp. NPDC001068]|uniref:TIGR03943 family putative permease subunit n=1 Tax=Streptomyces sp. NPDC001068 TaxID=3364544 RepID=UPI0036A34D8A
MRRPLQVTLLALSGLGLLHASLFTDMCLRYVKPGMRPLLVVSGFVLLVLAVAEAATRDSHARGAGPHGAGPHDAEPHSAEPHGAEPHSAEPHGHDHSAVPRVAWLLLLPALSLLFYAPPALGAYTASRQPAKVVAERDGFDALPSTSPLPITLTDFTTRVQQDRSLAIKGRTVQMSGLVTPVAGGGSWDLTRIIISCCAADAQSVKVRIYGSTVPPADTWVSVTGNWHPGGKLGTRSAPVAVDAQTVKRIRKPSNGYQDALPFPSG